MAIKIDGDDFNTYGTNGEEETYYLEEFSDEFLFFENVSGKITIDLRKVDFKDRVMDIAINNNMGICRIIVNEDVGVKLDIENEMGTLSNLNSSIDNISLIVRGQNTLGDVLVRHVL